MSGGGIRDATELRPLAFSVWRCEGKGEGRREGEGRGEGEGEGRGEGEGGGEESMCPS